MVVMYGRRRVGKTTLINEFIKDKPAIFFAAQEANSRLNLQMFSEKVYLKDNQVYQNAYVRKAKVS